MQLLANTLTSSGRWLVAVLLCAPVTLAAQGAAVQRPEPGATDSTTVAAPVEVTPSKRDEDIRARLQRVLVATGWFTSPNVRVDEGVVFLGGFAGSADLKKWAGDLARNTQGVVAVVNRMEVERTPIWDFTPASAGLRNLWRDFLGSLPLIAFGALILALSVILGIASTRGARRFLQERLRARLLRNVIARTAGVLVFLAGVYIILRVMSLTQLALTVVGGTGLVGLAVGIAFRDITENFLASIFLSIQHPFETGDLIEVAGVTGYVQQLNMRTTVVMTLDGNLVQVPNSTVYKASLRNFTTNSNRREDFIVGIDYGVAISDAQATAQRVLAGHDAVLADPEPWVLVDSLGPSTVNLRVYFWLDGRKHSWLKVRSSVIRLIKREFQQQGIAMPDGNREVVFPNGVPVTMVAALPGTPQSQAQPAAAATVAPAPDEVAAVSTKAEGGLVSDAGEIEAQARRAQPLKNQDNLLESQA